MADLKVPPLQSAGWRLRARTKRLLPGLVGLLFCVGPLTGANAAQFTPAPGFQPDDLRCGGIFDLGAADYNGDGRIDLFTTNHSGHSVLLENTAAGFQDVLSREHLDQTPAFPGWYGHYPPQTTGPGLYLYVQGQQIHILASPLSSRASGRLSFGFSVTVVQTDGADVSTSSTAGSPPKTHVTFAVDANEHVILQPEHLGLPIIVHLDTDLASVFIGANGVTPNEPDFTLELRDRHSIAWADYNDDRRLDAFIVRGGLRGAVEQYPNLVQDELALGSASGFTNVRSSCGLRKGSCRGRGAATVDFDGDNLLDLFATCWAGTPVLYRQLPDGTFTNASWKLNQVAGTQGSSYRWVDLDGDRLPELIVAHPTDYAVFDRKPSGSWVRYTVQGRQHGTTWGMTEADFNQDGTPDVFAAAGTGNTLLVNQSGTLVSRNPATRGLPASTGYTASWVDYDNNGRMDLHVLPHGLYRQRGDTSFEPTGLLVFPTANAGGLAIWPDLNNDGFRDPVIAPTASAGIQPFQSTPNGNRWLEIDLVGKDGNRQAVGARVTVGQGSAEQTQWVGQSNGSRYSQGDYRLYFGVGMRTVIRSVVVTWPNGTTRHLSDVTTNRIVTIIQ